MHNNSANEKAPSNTSVIRRQSAYSRKNTRTGCRDDAHSVLHWGIGGRHTEKMNTLSGSHKKATTERGNGKERAKSLLFRVEGQGRELSNERPTKVGESRHRHTLLHFCLSLPPSPLSFSLSVFLSLAPSRKQIECWAV